MTAWGSGYVTDITYMTGYYRQQSPSLIAVACLLNGVASPMPEPDAPVSYLELGCGQGFGALLLAASNPSWIVTAIDFHPAHIATARTWAAMAQLDNIQFIEADLAGFAESEAARQVPEADFVSMHGLWSWVPAPVQAGVVRLLRDKVKPGGAAHLSYNALPAWGSALGMQRLMREAGQRAAATRSDRQAAEGLKVVQELHAAEALQLRRSPWVNTLLDRMGTLPAPYLAHEYMNEAWQPCFHADVAATLADAKLDWVGSAMLVDNFPDLMLTEEQRAIVNRFDDPLLRELMKDMCAERSLRHDVFVRGARRINPMVRDAALMELSLSTNLVREDMPTEAEVPAGRAALSPAFYGPIIEALGKGPQRVRDLLALPQIEGRRDNPAELIGIMMGLDMVEPALRPGAAQVERARRFNHLALESLSQTENFGRPIAAASHQLGTGAPCTLFDLYVLERVLEGQDEGRMEDWVAHLGVPLDETGRGNLRKLLTKCLNVRVPLLRAAGVA